MEWNDEKKIDFPERIMDGADRRQHHAGGACTALAKHRYPKILMLVVTARDDFIIADEENPPAADGFANSVSGPESAAHDIGSCGSLQAQRPYDRVADDQQQLQQQRRVSEDGGIDVHNSEIRPRQRRANRIMEVG